MSIVKCKVCGKEIDGSLPYCMYCGAAVADAEEQPAAAEYEAPAAEKPPKYTAPQQNMKTPRKSGFNTFNAVTPAVIAVLCMLFILLAAVSESRFLSGMNLRSMLIQFFSFAGFAVAATLSVRSKGLDLSLPGISVLAACITAAVALETESVILGFFAALPAAAAIGALNGVFISFVKTPPVITTLITGFLARGITFAAFKGAPIQPPVKVEPTLAILIGLIIIGCGIVVSMFLTPRGKTGWRGSETRSIKAFLIYIICSVLGALIGLSSVIRLRAAVPTLAEGHEIFMIFAAACLVSWRAVNRRGIAVIAAVLSTVVWTLMTVALSLTGADMYVQRIIGAVLAAVMLLFAALSLNMEKRSQTE